MGYFNYFIKCIIRNISYKLCKPKVFLTVLLSVAVLFVLHNTGYCAEWTDGEIEACLDGLSTITSNQGTIISQLSSLGIDVDTMQKDLTEINNLISGINSTTSNISDKITTVIAKIDTLNTTLTQLAQQQNLYYQDVTNELKEIKNILTGSAEEISNQFFKQDNSFWLYPNPSGVSMTSTVYDSNPGNGRFFQACHFRDTSSNVDYVFEKGYTYTISCTEILTSNSGSGRFYYTYDVISNGNEIYSYYVGNFTQNNFTFTFTPIKDGVIYFYTENFGPFWSGMCRYTISKVPNGSLSSIGDNLNNVNNSINQGNQLQQEQNDFLKQEQSDSDVSIDGFNNIDSNDITTSGLTGIFTTIYNSISSWNSKNIVFPISFAGTSMTIPGNLTENFILSIGGQPILTVIHTVYYFIVARFIIYSITGIINSIKSGSILNTDTKNNITTEML